MAEPILIPFWTNHPWVRGSDLFQWRGCHKGQKMGSIWQILN